MVREYHVRNLKRFTFYAIQQDFANWFEIMSDLFDSSSFSDKDDKGIDPELAELLMVEKQKAQFNAQVKDFNADKPFSYWIAIQLLSQDCFNIILCMFSFGECLRIYVARNFHLSCGSFMKVPKFFA